MYKIRKKELADCKDTTYVVVKAWNDTYRGIVSEKFLSNLWETKEEIIKREEKNFTDYKEKYILEVDNKVVGFITFGPSRLEEYQNYGEIYAFYILKEYQNQGYGRKLLKKSFDILRKQGYSKIIIGCLEKNNSTKFYEHLGGILKKKVKRKIGDEQLVENIYLFK